MEDACRKPPVEVEVGATLRPVLVLQQETGRLES